jgi:hypothetical protein
MRADSLRGRIIGALARASSEASSSEASSSASSPAGLPGWTEYEHTALSRYLLRLQRSSAAGRIVVAVARTETAGPDAPYTPACQVSSPDAPTSDAQLIIVFAGQHPPAKKTPKPVAVSSPSFPRESVLDERPTLAALLRISLGPA